MVETESRHVEDGWYRFRRCNCRRLLACRGIRLRLQSMFQSGRYKINDAYSASGILPTISLDTTHGLVSQDIVVPAMHGLLN
jgi:hypothetical protein